MKYLHFHFTIFSVSAFVFFMYGPKALRSGSDEGLTSLLAPDTMYQWFRLLLRPLLRASQDSG